jgi:uncharacterized protein (TIGR02246 family)
MTARNPADVHRLFAQAVASNNLDALVDLYEADAVLVPEPGRIIHGREGIRANLGDLLALKPKLESETTAVVPAGGLAMLRSRWNLIGTRTDGTAVRLSGESTEIVRLQPDGSWKCVIDNPYSTG